MATNMIWITVLSTCLIITLAETANEQDSKLQSSVNSENYVLNLHHDHCKSPMSFSWKHLKCECPAPFTRSGNDCVCNGCIFEDIQLSHFEGTSSHLPEYINEIFEEIDEDVMESQKTELKLDKSPTTQGDSANDAATNELGTHDAENETVPDDDDGEFGDDNLNDEPSFDQLTRRRRSIEDHENQFQVNKVAPVKIRRLPVNPSARRSVGSHHRYTSRRHLRPQHHNNLESIKPEDNTPIRRVLNEERHAGVGSTSQPTKKNIIQLLSRQPLTAAYGKNSKILYLKKQPNRQVQTFSDSVIAGNLNGSTISGFEHSIGKVKVHQGSGALALGSGGGTAGTAAFTGHGSSDLAVESIGASAAGQALIGKNMKKAASTTSLLIGQGDAIAINAVGAKGVSSAAGFSTKHTAGSATAAFGPASASVSATPGRGSVSSSANFGNGLNTAAMVEGENGTVVESTAVGNPDDDINKLAVSPDIENNAEPINIEPTQFDFESFFGN